MQFIGGEPTLYPGLGQLVEHAHSLGFERIEVFTNGTSISEDLKRAFLRCRTSLAFSVYSADPEVHDLITQQRGSMERTMASIRWALGAGLGLRVAIIVMDANSARLDQTIQMLRDAGVSQIGTDRVRAVGRGERSATPVSKLGEMCGSCGRDQLSVSYDGQAYPCVFSHFWPLGNASAGLDSLMSGDEIRTFRETVRSLRRRGPIQDAPREPNTQCGPSQPLTSPCQPEPVQKETFPREPSTRCEPEQGCEPDQTPPPPSPFELTITQREANPCEPDIPCEPDHPPPGPCEPDYPQPCEPDYPPRES